MVYTKFAEFWKLSNRIYRTMGMVPYDKAAPSNRRRMLFVRYIQLAPLTFFTVNFVYDFALLGKAGDIQLCIMMLSYFGFLVNSLSKMVYVHLGKQQLNRLIDELNALYPVTLRQQRKMHVAMYQSRCQRISKFYALFFMIQIWMFNLYPLLEYMIFELWLQQRTVGKKLPYLVHLPWDYHGTFSFGLLYVLQCGTGYMAASSQVAPDVMIGAITTHLIMHCEHLAHELLVYRVKGQHDDDLEFLRTIVVYHQKIYQLVDSMNEVFGVPIFCSFFASAFVICFVGFQITLGGSTDLVLKLCFYLIGSILQVYLICWYSQELINASQGVAAAVYNQQWHRGDVSYKKMLILIMKRAQIPAQLRGTMFLSISRRTVTDLLQISYKFFAMLRTMYGN